GAGSRPRRRCWGLPAGRRSPILNGRPSTPMYWASTTRPRADSWSSTRNCRAIYHVYIMDCVRPRCEAGRLLLNKRGFSTGWRRRSGSPGRSLGLERACFALAPRSGYVAPAKTRRRLGERRRNRPPKLGGITPGGRYQMAHAATLPILTAESGLTRYLEEIRRFPMLEPQEEYMLAKRWREHGDRDAAHRLVTSHLRLVAKIAMGYRGYGLPIAEVISEGNVGLMQAVKRFEPEKGFRLATYAMWWIKASIQEYILRSW